MFTNPVSTSVYQPYDYQPQPYGQSSMSAASMAVGVGGLADDQSSDFFSSYDDPNAPSSSSFPPAPSSMAQAPPQALGYQMSAPSSWGYDYSGMAMGGLGRGEQQVYQSVEAVGVAPQMMAWSQDQAQSGGYGWDGHQQQHVQGGSGVHAYGEMKDITF